MKSIHILSLAIISLIHQDVNALVTGTIKIVGGVGTQFLPGSYVNTFPRWTAERNVDQSVEVSRMIGSGNDLTSAVMTFVDPTSNAELWWPSDLDKLQFRPSLNFLIKGAIPAYALAGVEVRVPSDASKNGKEWRNFGMNCQPLASQWTDFNIAIENGFRVETFYGKSKGKGEEDEEEESIDWKDISGSGEESCTESAVEERKTRAQEGTKKALETLATLLVSMEDESPLVDGMHIVSIPVSDEWTDLPSLKGEDETYKLVSVGTVESDAKELLNMGEDMIEMSATSLLNVEVSQISPGGESEYMPVAYHDLYK